MMKRLILVTALALALGSVANARPDPSRGSETSALAVGLSVAVPVVLLVGGGMLVVASVESTAQGTVWVLERASDGARGAVNFSANAAGHASVAAGTAVTAVACSAGWVLSAAGQAVAFIPNEIGRTLMHNERVTR